jgi:hypothetical protein
VSNPSTNSRRIGQLLTVSTEAGTVQLSLLLAK